MANTRKSNKVPTDAGFDNGLMAGVVIRPSIDDVVKKHGVSVDDFVKCMKGGLSATRMVKDDMGISEEVADWNVRHKFFATGMELLGYLRGSGTTVNVNQTEEKKEAEEAFKRWRQPSMADAGSHGQAGSKN